MVVFPLLYQEVCFAYIMGSGEECVICITFQYQRMLSITWRSENSSGVYESWVEADLVYKFCQLKVLPWQLNTSFNLLN